MKKLVFFLIFFACSNPETKKHTILPTETLENERVHLFFDSDSIKISTNCPEDFTKYVYVSLRSKDEQEKVLNLALENDTVSFVVPAHTAYISYRFYSVCDAEEDYRTIRVKKDATTFVENAFYDKMADTMYLNQELGRYPSNLSAYANHLVQLGNLFYRGKISDSTVYEAAAKSLKIISHKIDRENPSHLATLATLYAFQGEFQQSEAILLDIYKQYPNSQILVNAATNYWFAEYLLRKDGKERVFYESLVGDVAKNHPNSPFGVNIIDDAYEDNIYAHFFTSEDILNNLYSYRNTKQEKNYLIQQGIVKMNIKLNKLEQAQKEALIYLNLVKENLPAHYSPLTKEQRSKLPVPLSVYIAEAHELLAEIAIKQEKKTEAMLYLDSAYQYYSKNQHFEPVKKYISNVVLQTSSLQKQLGKHKEALQTYETLYQETQDERVLDSIKVLFKEMQQEKGFESYVVELKNKIENKLTSKKELASDFSIKDMSGYEIKLSEWKDRLVVLNFWGNYCSPCAKEIPHLNKIWQATQTQPVIFLAATKNTPLEVTRFAQRQKEIFSFSILPNAKELFEAYDIKLIPTTIVINQKGEIIYQETGFYHSLEKLEKIIQKELEKS